MRRRRWKRLRSWKAPVHNRPTGLSLIRRVSSTALDRPPEGLPGFVVAALPFALVIGISWKIPGFWQMPAVVAAGAVVGILILRIDWPVRVKTAVACAVIAMTAVAFAASGTEVGPFVLPIIGLSFALSLLRVRAIERDERNRDAWRKDVTFPPGSDEPSG